MSKKEAERKILTCPYQYPPSFENLKNAANATSCKERTVRFDENIFKEEKINIIEEEMEQEYEEKEITNFD